MVQWLAMIYILWASSPGPQSPSSAAAISSPEPEKVTYQANCHCAAIKFTVKIPDLYIKSSYKVNPMQLLDLHS